MFCPECKCEFVGWTSRCPVCKTPLVRKLPVIPMTIDEPISYEALVNLVGEHGDQLRIDLSTTDIGMEKKWSFPYFGYGFAWAKRMQGAFNNISIDLLTTEVGMEKRQGFPYRGYRFAWTRRMQGHVGGNPVILTAKKIVREQKQGFPYFGYGFAWTQEMSGECGNQLKVDLAATKVGKDEERGFPYRGYGFAWIEKGVLTLAPSA